MVKPYALHLGNCLDTLKTYPDNSIDSIVTDPPYGISFMSKKWDYDVPSVEIWQECLRVLKPGGYLLSFASTRTQHRMAVNIEDAGFTIKDCITWVYSSGFPKSHNVSCAIDKSFGHPNRGRAIPTASTYQASDVDKENKLTSNEVAPYEPITDEAKAWQGWGTALKPACEIITIAHKPTDIQTERDIIVYSLNVLEKKIWLLLSVNVAQRNFSVNHPELNEALSFAQWNVENVFNTLDDLLEVMDTLQLEVVLNSSLNIVSLWKSSLEEYFTSENTSTIKMELNTIIDLKILKSLVLKITPNCIVKESLSHAGLYVDVPIAIQKLNAYVTLLKNIQTVFAIENATFQTKDLLDQEQIKPACEPITVAQKPIKGTIASNVLKWGTGAINIDATRVPMDEDDFAKLSAGVEKIRERGGVMDNSWKNSSDLSGANPANPLGRWGANFIHDGSQEVLDLFPDAKGCKGSGLTKSEARSWANQSIEGINRIGYNDNGSAARFFYCSKSNKKDRNEGLEGLEPKQYSHDGRETRNETAYQRNDSVAANHHPTVKPTDLMCYLVRMVTRLGGTVLDPFMGSGTTGKAAMREGMNFIGCELDAEYLAIAEKRIQYELDKRV